MINQACPQRYASLLARCEFQAPQRSRCMGAEEVRTEGCLFIGQRGLSLLCATLRVNQTARGSPINDFMSGPVTHFTVFECSKYPRVLPVKKRVCIAPSLWENPLSAAEVIIGAGWIFACVLWWHCYELLWNLLSCFHVFNDDGLCSVSHNYGNNGQKPHVTEKKHTNIHPL